VARKRRTREKQSLPPPLPPETRTVGQLVAETIRFYGAHFWRSLALGLGPAGVTVAAYEVGWHPALAGVGVAYLILATSSYIGACLLVAGRRPPRRVVLNAFGLGAFVVLPVLALSFGLVLAPAWLAFFGLSVPAALLEELPPREAFRRGIELGRADYVHAFGSLCALALVVFLTQGLLFSLLHGGSQQAIDVSAFLAALVVQPLLFLGGAILYVDQAARSVSSRARATRRPDADVSHAHNTH
jgi:hypothetical protein